MMRLRNCLWVLILAFGFQIGGTVVAQDLDILPDHKFFKDAWKPAPTPPGAIGWATLAGAAWCRARSDGARCCH